MSQRLRTDRRNLQGLRDKWTHVSARPKVGKKQSAKVAKERLAQICEALMKRIEPHLELIDIPAATRDVEPEDEALAARVEMLHKHLGEVSARIVRLREEVPALVEKAVGRELHDGSAAAVVPAPPSEVTVPAPLPARLRDGVERNYAELVSTLTKLDQSYPATLDKARRIKSVAEQRVTSRTESVIQQELKATVASPRTRTPGKRTPPKRR